MPSDTVREHPGCGYAARMTQFLLLFVGKQAQPDAEDTQTQDYNAKWAEWMGNAARSGALVSGSPLEFTGKVVSKDGVTDLELEPVDIGGFVIVNASSADDAAELASTIPAIPLGGTVIIRPCIPVT
jgi:hypothetical protein